MVRHGGGGEVKPKATALAREGFHTRLTAHALGAFADNGQTNAGPGIGISRMKALEQAEDFLMLVRFDADAVVLNKEADRSFARLRRDEPRPVGLRRGKRGSVRCRREMRLKVGE